MSGQVSAKPRRLGAYELVTSVLDADSWVGWDSVPLAVAEPGSAYAAELAEAAERAGTDESVITGQGRIGGRRVAIIAGEFRFMAGSIGRTAAERVVLAFERATREGRGRLLHLRRAGDAARAGRRNGDREGEAPGRTRP